jgi:hypothetical protein
MIRSCAAIKKDIRIMEHELSRATKCMDHYVSRFDNRGSLYWSVLKGFFETHCQLKAAHAEMEASIRCDAEAALVRDACVFIAMNQLGHGNFDPVLRTIAEMAGL